MLHAAQAAEPAVDHDGHPGAKCFTLLHAVKKHKDEVSQKIPKLKGVLVYNSFINSIYVILLSSLTCERSGLQIVPL